jgi:Uma2 family endonuclease
VGLVEALPHCNQDMTELVVKEEALLRLPGPALSDDEFFELCISHPEYRIERTAGGRIVVKLGTGGKTSNRNADLTAQLHARARKDARGIAFDSNALFLLPNRAILSPGAAWVARARLDGIRERDKERILPLCPDFVVELTSPSDRLPEVQEKMVEWMANGCELGWILDPARMQVHVYREKSVDIRTPITEIAGDRPVENFMLDLTGIWGPGW